MILGFSCIQQEGGIGFVSLICRLGKEVFCFLPPASCLGLWGPGAHLSNCENVAKSFGDIVLLSFLVSLLHLDWAVRILYSTGVFSHLPFWG